MERSRIIEESIPDELRLATHPDAELVNSLIATLIVADDESEAWTAKGKRKDIKAAIKAWYETVYVPHIAKEDEDWGNLNKAVETHKAEAEALRIEADSLRPPPKSEAEKLIERFNAATTPDEVEVIDNHYLSLASTMSRAERMAVRGVQREAETRVATA